MNENVGKQIGKYKIVDYLGRGAMAEVYKAYHPTLDRFVAIKVLHSFLAEKTDILNRFQREARNVAALNHPHIVQVHDFDVDGAMYYMVMEFIDGPTLKQMIRERHSQGQLLPLREVIEIIRDVGLALSYAHERDVVHRDVKPANVMIARDKRAVLTDFGLAKIVSGPQFTATGALVGTPAYMSPEQGQGKPGDARSDIYSLGVMLYQLTTGRLPFTAESPLGIVFKHINAPVPNPCAINPDLPMELEAVILKSLAKNPLDRYQVVDRMLEELLAVELPPREDGAKGIFRPSAPAKIEGVSISLHIVETGQIIPLGEGDEFTLGRMDGGVRPDVDLSPFRAYQLGVSRLHARLRIDEGKEVTICDLGSTNGTWVNGHKLTVEVPERLHHGDVIALGKLMIQVLIRL